MSMIMKTLSSVYALKRKNTPKICLKSSGYGNVIKLEAHGTQLHNPDRHAQMEKSTSPYIHRKNEDVFNISPKTTVVWISFSKNIKFLTKFWNFCKYSAHF